MSFLVLFKCEFLIKKFSRNHFWQLNNPYVLCVMQFSESKRYLKFSICKKRGPAFFKYIVLTFPSLHLNKLNFKTAIQFGPLISGFCICGFNQQCIKNIWKNFTNSSKIRICLIPVTCLHSICFVFTTIYLEFPLKSEL